MRVTLEPAALPDARRRAVDVYGLRWPKLLKAGSVPLCAVSELRLFFRSLPESTGQRPATLAGLSAYFLQASAYRLSTAAVLLRTRRPNRIGSNGEAGEVACYVRRIEYPAVEEAVRWQNEATR